jgi:hypothetical protein
MVQLYFKDTFRTEEESDKLLIKRKWYKRRRKERKKERKKENMRAGTKSY